MRRFMVLVTVVLLMTVMLEASAGGAQAAPSGTVTLAGTPVPATVCESPAIISPIIGWRGGTCWVFHVGE